MKPIPPEAGDGMQATDSNDLLRLARQFSGLIRVQCIQCREWVRLSVENRTLRIGSSPDLAALDSTQTGKPRLLFFCPQCRRIMGHIQADVWVDSLDTTNGSEATRWNHLELEQNDTGD